MICMIDIDAAYEWSQRYDNDYIGSAVDSVTLGELVDDGWIDFSKKAWDFPKYSDAQHKQLCNKIVNHYYSRELGILPPKQWKREFLRKLDEIMPKYIMLYKVLDTQGANGINATDEFYKSRNIVSDFPQTQLAGNEDYASMGTDHEYERVHQGTLLETVDGIKSYDDVDLLIIDELESMFSCLLTVNVNCW